MRLYRAFLLFLLTILIVIIFKLPEYFNTKLYFSYPILNFHLSIRIIILSFLLVAFLIVIQAKNLSILEILFFFIYTIFSICALLSKKLLLAIIFSELTSIIAFFIISSTFTKKSMRSALRYAYLHFFIGVILTVGLAIQNYYIIIISLLINCGCFPFSFFIVDSYPSASLHGASYLSLFATKISFLITILHTYDYWKNFDEIIALFGTITSIYGIMFASFERNLRRFLAYSIVGQMGLLIVKGSLLCRSENSIPLLIFNIIFSISYQALFISIVNSIILRWKIVTFNNINSRLISLNGLCALIAIFTMVGFPGTSGFVSKLYIESEIEIYGTHLQLYKNLYKILDSLFYLSVGFKFIYYIFFTKNEFKFLKKETLELPVIILASICLIIGNPYLPIYNKSVIFGLIYNMRNVYSQFISLFYSILFFFFFYKIFAPRISFKVNMINWILKNFSIFHIILFLNKLVLEIKKTFIKKVQIIIRFFIILFFKCDNKFKKMSNYHSIGFIPASSIFLISILLMLLCLNH